MEELKAKICQYLTYVFDVHENPFACCRLQIFLMITKKITLKVFGVGIFVILLDVYNPLFISIKQFKKNL